MRYKLKHLFFYMTRQWTQSSACSVVVVDWSGTVVCCRTATVSSLGCYNRLSISLCHVFNCITPPTLTDSPSHPQLGTNDTNKCHIDRRVTSSSVCGQHHVPDCSKATRSCPYYLDLISLKHHLSIILSTVKWKGSLIVRNHPTLQSLMFWSTIVGQRS